MEHQTIALILPCKRDDCKGPGWQTPERVRKCGLSAEVFASAIRLVLGQVGYLPHLNQRMVRHPAFRVGLQ